MAEKNSNMSVLIQCATWAYGVVRDRSRFPSVRLCLATSATSATCSESSECRSLLSMREGDI